MRTSPEGPWDRQEFCVCGWIGDDVDDHIVYMTTVVKDEEEHLQERDDD